jgi:predicted nucleic acid-binding protein
MSFSAFMEGDARLDKHRARLKDEDEVYISVVTTGEVIYGLERLPQSRRRTRLEQELEIALNSIDGVLDVTQAIARRWGTLKRDLEKHGTPIGDDNDLWIAAVALVHSITLVSSQKSFRYVKGVKVKDWLK